MAAKRSSKLTQTAMLKQILKRCSSLGKKQCYDEEGLPLDVPKGHFPVYVGKSVRGTSYQSPSCLIPNF
ncbi:hypothetical protein Bca52824_091708 [Brassica carinata]|uniref:Uncharacterized protein n=1 Tax=Brassica carinata TaxID=52824 RepID=A0A8X7TF71_BRACI|nr:hypothetical protein Bca52824_091708 [Brassica carinata]